MTDYTYDSLQESIDDHARSALATMSPPMRRALAQVAGSDTDIHDRELASLRARGLITNASQITTLGWAVHDRMKITTPEWPTS